MIRRYKQHGHYNSPTYISWKQMKARCSGSKQYEERYGSRGIWICDRWAASFQSFLDDMGERPDGMSIDRIDNDGGYEPGNCRWATRREQAVNRRSTVFVEHNGRRKCLADWARDIGVRPRVVWQRIRLQRWPVHLAVTTPHCRPTRQRVIAKNVWEPILRAVAGK